MVVRALTVLAIFSAIASGTYIIETLTPRKPTSVAFSHHKDCGFGITRFSPEICKHRHL